MTLTEALQGGANIILTGHPGSGKTVALAWLAASIARNDPGLGVLEGLLPLYLHGTDIFQLLNQTDELVNDRENSRSDKRGSKSVASGKKNQNTSVSLEVLIKAISTYVSPSSLNRLPGVIRGSLEKQRAILILDRVDELPPNQAKVITGYLQLLSRKYPKLRIITASSYDDLAGLPPLGFSLLAMAAWTDDDRESFLRRWSQLWDKWIHISEKKQAKKINSSYLNSWLKIENTLLNPLEYMLKVWAAYSGDILGTDGPSAIEAHIRRLTSDVLDSRARLEGFALQFLFEMSFKSIPHDSIQEINNQAEDTNPTTDNPASEDSSSNRQAEPVQTIRIKALSGSDILTNNGFLVSYTGSQYGFSHPIFSGYLAGSALASTGTITRIQSQSSWIGKTLAMYYFAGIGDVSPLINELIQEDDILHTNHLIISRWLQIAPKNRQWRTSILRTLTTILNKEKDTLSLAAKIISAMAFSRDAGVSVY